MKQQAPNSPGSEIVVLAVEVEVEVEVAVAVAVVEGAAVVKGEVVIGSHGSHSVSLKKNVPFTRQQSRRLHGWTH